MFVLYICVLLRKSWYYKMSKDNQGRKGILKTKVFWRIMIEKVILKVILKSSAINYFHS